MNPNEMRDREMREWLEKALDDLESARVLAAANHAANAQLALKLTRKILLMLSKLMPLLIVASTRSVTLKKASKRRLPPAVPKFILSMKLTC